MTRTALVADDSVAVRKLVAARLAVEGYRVREAEDGYAALLEIEERLPDLLIVDDVLAGLSGAELVHALHAHDALRSVPIAFLVEYPAGLRRAALVGLDADSIIQKPFDLDEFARRIRAIVESER
jgi:DNA-binding response OmpR family regulator